MSNLQQSPFTRLRRLHLLALFSALALSALMALSSATETAKAISTYQIPASIASDCSVDVTQPILTWIASVPDSSVLSCPSGACYRIEGTLDLRGRTGLDFNGNGATFQSFNPPADQRAIWRVIGSANMVFRNMTIIGSYANGGTFASSLQHAHAIDLRGTSAQLANLNMSRLAGDCVYLGLGYDGVTQSSGSVHDSTCSLIGRNAVSVTAGKNITVQRVTADKIGFTVFDVEPNVGPGWGASNVTFDSNTIGSYYLYAWALVENAPISDQWFTNNTVTGRGLRIAAVDPGSQGVRPQRITITGNSSNTAQWAPAMEFHNIDTLGVTSNVVPLAGGTMATVDVSCNPTVSGNSYPGGTSQVLITNTPASCASAPTISAFTPSSGPVGTSVTLTGAGFTGATAVAFNGTSVSFTVKSDTQISTIVPSGATSGSISVTTPAGTGTSSKPYRVRSR
jgi:hypothetical protein